MITLTNGPVNPAFIESTTLRTGEQTADGGYYIVVNNCHYWSPTKTAVVIYFASGRIEVHGGLNGNAIWMELQGMPMCADSDPVVVLEGRGLVVNLHGAVTASKAICGDATYEWACNAPATMKSDELADALLRLLVDNEYVSSEWLNGYEAQFDGGLSVVTKGQYRDEDLLIAFHTN